MIRYHQYKSKSLPMIVSLAACTLFIGSADAQETEQNEDIAVVEIAKVVRQEKAREKDQESQPHVENVVLGEAKNTIVLRAHADAEMAAKAVEEHKLKLAKAQEEAAKKIEVIREMAEKKIENKVSLAQLEEYAHALHNYKMAASDQRVALQRELEHLTANMHLINSQLKRIQSFEKQFQSDASESREAMMASANEFAIAAKKYVSELNKSLTEHEYRLPKLNAVLVEGSNEVTLEGVHEIRNVQLPALVKRINQQLHEHEKAAVTLKEMMRTGGEQQRQTVIIEQAKAKALEAEEKVLAAEKKRKVAELKWKGISDLRLHTNDGEIKSLQDVPAGRVVILDDIAQYSEDSEARLKALESRLQRMETLLQKLVDQK